MSHRSGGTQLRRVRGRLWRMRTPSGLVATFAAVALGLSTAVAGCSDSAGEKPVVAVTLPAGDLSDQVLQPDDVPEGLVPLLAQTGTADINRIAGFSTDSAAAEKSLREHGFEKAYVAQYGDPKTGRYIVNVVVSFATEEGATADLTADLDAARATGSPFPVEGLGDQAGGVRAVPGGAATTPSPGATVTTSTVASPATSPSPPADDLVTVRWRKASTTWLLAVGARGTVEQDAVVGLAKIILERATKPGD